MTTTIALLVLVLISGSITGAMIFPHMSWKGVMAGAGGAVAVFCVLTCGIFLGTMAMGSFEPAKAASFLDADSDGGLVSGLSGT